MPFIPVENTAMVEIRGLIAGQKVENTLYFEKSSAYSTADLEGIGDVIITWWQDNMAPITSSQYELREVYITDLSTDTSAAVSRVPADATFGAVGGEILPLNVSFSISFRTAFRGRSFRGRNYFCGFVLDQVDSNTVNATQVLAIRNAYFALLGVASDFGVTWVVVSRHHNKAPRATGVTAPVLAVVAADNIVDSQRRRLPSRGT
jgi:hypothetical protein